MRFTKMHGNGNDFIVIEDLQDIYINNEREIWKNLCDRHFGIGADGVLIVRKSKIADIKMVIINSDGSYAAMCGNGIRCFAKYVWEMDISKKSRLKIETGDGIKEALLTIDNNKVKEVTINMGQPNFQPQCIPACIDEPIIEKCIEVNKKQYKITSMLMGVPHTVILGKLDGFDVKEGSCIEKFRLFPEGTNVNFCEVINRNEIKVETWERGAGATLACGTGSCASVIAANKLNLVDSKATVCVPGGILKIEITRDGVLMTGPAEIIFTGEYNA